MIPKGCKRLAEVDFPIAVVSKHAAREKSIRHGHPSTLHLWWARRPLASCRAVLLGILLPDPCDPLCPQTFKREAARILLGLPGWNTPKRKEQVQSEGGLRQALLDYIGEVANWDLANDTEWISPTRELVKAAYPGEPPLVVDPFAGGGSIPLEALRLGCEAFASDLNPVACLILKVMLEDIPRYGPQLAEELLRLGGEIKRQAEKELSELYPIDDDGSTPIAYLWARTVRCEAPRCGAEIPLVRSFWLCKKEGRKRALRPVNHPGDPKGPGRENTRCSFHIDGEIPHVVLELFEPESDKEVPEGTVSRARARCLCCNTVLPPERVRAQLALQRGGADVIFNIHGRRIGGARLLAVVTVKPDQSGRHYRLPTESDYQAVWKAQKRLGEILMEWERSGREGLCPVPDEPTPEGGGSGAGRAFSVNKYGMLQWGDLFSARQKVALVTLARLVLHVSNQPPTLKELVAMQITKGADGNNSGVGWMPAYENPAHLFARQAIPIVWDFCESSPYADARGVFLSALVKVSEIISTIPNYGCGQLQIADAMDYPLPDESADV